MGTPDLIYLQNSKFGLGDAVVEGWRFFRKNLWANLLIGLLNCLPLVLFEAILIGSFRDIAFQLITSPVPLLCLAFFLVAVYLAFNCVGTGALAYITSKTAYGESAHLGSALRHGFFRLKSVFGTSILSGVLTSLAALALVFPGIYLGTCYAFGLVTAALRYTSGMEALNYSKHLVDGRWLRVFGGLVAISLFSYAISILTLVFQSNIYVMLVANILTLGFSFCFSTVLITVLFLNLEFQYYGRTTAVSTQIEPRVREIIIPIPAEAVEPERQSAMTAPSSEIEVLAPEAPVQEPAVQPETPLQNQGQDKALPAAMMPVVVGESLPALEQQTRNNDALAAFLFALLSLLLVGVSYLVERASLPSIAASFGMMIILTIIMGIQGIKKSTRMEGKRKGLAWGGLGLGVIAIALMAVLIIAPPLQVVEANNVRLYYPEGWMTVNTNLVPPCQENDCVVALVEKDGESNLMVIRSQTDALYTIEQIDQIAWTNIQGSGDVKLLESSFLTVDGQPASRRVFIIADIASQVYVVYGIILTKTYAYEYYGTSTSESEYQRQVRSMDGMIQSMKISAP